MKQQMGLDAQEDWQLKRILKGGETISPSESGYDKI